jgi:predicted Zn finger-like uncharacterized protein
MPEQVRCPSCNSALRVPESLLGKNVKCPKCEATFLAQMEEPAQPEGIVREPTPAANRLRMPDDAGDDDHPPDDYEDEDYPRRRRGGRGLAESLVSGPATALLVVGIIDLILAVLNLILPVFSASMMAAGGGAKAANNPDFLVNMFSGVFGSVMYLVWGSLITFGSLKMKQLNSYGLAMTASILAMIPCGNCCLLGLPFGIWALIVICKPEVKDAFT